MHASLHGRPTSIWMDTTPATAYPPLGAALAVDVCVVGGGLFGLLCAALLKRSGRTVAVVEADRVGTGVTGFTTAKVCVLHGLVYDQVRSRFGEEGARHYAAANTAGLELIADWVAERGVACDFRRRPAFTYAEEGGDVESLEKEVAAARDAGLDAELVVDPGLPWPVAGAVRLDGQAEFHPRRFLLDVAAFVDGDGSHVLERTRATGVHDGNPCRVETDLGAEVQARDVVIATHYPILDRGAFFARMSVERSYAVAVRVRGPVPHGMFLSTESPSHSVRAVPHDGEELLILGGESHKPGSGGDTRRRVERLERWAREHVEVESVEYRWSAQDGMPVDGVPLVGRLWPLARHLWTAAGFKKWGMTNGAAAAIMVADAIEGRENPWRSTFGANRFKPLASAPALLKEQLSVGAHFVGDRLGAPGFRAVEDLAPGEGGIVRSGGDKVAAFRDDDGTVHAVSPVCTHLHCQVNWNAAERSWDCPCHGSRFGVDGRVLEGPAVHRLEQREVPPTA